MAGLPLSPSYVRVVSGTLYSVLAAAVTDGLIPRNPVAGIRRPKVPARRVEPWLGQRVAKVRDTLPERYRLLVDIGSGLGLRQGEIFGLPPGDITDWLRPGRSVVHVKRQVRQVGGQRVFSLPKGGKERDVPLPESVKLALAAHLERFPARPVTLPWREPGGKPVTVSVLLTTPDGNALGKNGFNRTTWRPALAKAGVPFGRENGCHALRHYFASVLLHGGTDIKALSEYLGHHSAAFTLSVYTNPWELHQTGAFALVGC